MSLASLALSSSKPIEHKTLLLEKPIIKKQGWGKDDNAICFGSYLAYIGSVTFAFSKKLLNNVFSVARTVFVQADGAQFVVQLRLTRAVADVTAYSRRNGQSTIQRYCDHDNAWQTTSYLDEKLRGILLNDKIKDLPVAVVSVAGAYRGGKSFLLNFFLRYLSASQIDRENGSWLGDDTTELVGFSWRGGSVRNTTGIVMWPEAFIIRIPTGEKVAVLLMDTQGTFDSTSTLFTDYGKLMKDQTGKAFQVLEFLVRDWMSPWEYNYGHDGGDLYLANKLKVDVTQPKELQELRIHINSSFDKVTCFLMPHPGLGVANPAFKGRPRELTPEFAKELKELATSIFSPDNLSMKLLGGQPVKSRELFNYFKTYMTIFNSDTIPTPTTILAATSEAGLLMAANEAREQFENNMKLACGPDALSMPALDVIELHTQQLAAARATFKARKLFGNQADIDKKLEELDKELTDRRNDYLEINKSKTMKAQNSGRAAYEAAIQKVTHGKILCVHAKDLKKVHEDALAAAVSAFDENRKKPAPGKTDPDREKLINQNNKSNASEVKSEYYEYMMLKCTADTKLTEDQFKVEHEGALKRALEEFESRRNRPNSYSEDVFKFKLEQVSELRKHCLHPDDLKQVHNEAVCLALQAFRPQRTCGEGFDTEKFDELSSSFWYFLASWATATGYHNEALGLAMEAFYGKRRDRKYHEKDSYISDLTKKCKNYYDPKGKA
ncbi:Guanylate-binding protein [Operophtera brumata]|uniref:Guanylate-binding protein n=1 Tax=Operophtera brumata TaxID=104452 RepID=A0A0L7LS17_OPEBR|nr:Guanylate-binding protein [Operophtera brumata]